MIEPSNGLVILYNVTASVRQQPLRLVSSIASSSVEAVTTVFTSSPLSSMMQLTR